MDAGAVTGLGRLALFRRRSILNQHQKAVDRGDLPLAQVREYALSIHNDFEFVVGMAHFRANAVLLFQFALQAPGQAS